MREGREGTRSSQLDLFAWRERDDNSAETVGHGRLSLQFIPSSLPMGPGFGLPHFILFTDWASDPFGSRPRASVYHSLPAEHGAGAC